MEPLEVFFDYACPYCYKAHDLLLICLQQYPDMEIIWRPCESHPRPDPYGPHSDLLIQGYFFALDKQIDPLIYHQNIYALVFEKRVEIENLETLVQHTKAFLPAEEFKEALLHKTYLQKQLEANQYAFEKNDVWVVPAYRYKGKKLDAVENIGVSKKQLISLFAE